MSPYKDFGLFVLNFSLILCDDKFFTLKYFRLYFFLKAFIEYTRLDDKKIILDLSLTHLFNIFKVPSKFVLKTLFGIYTESFTAASAQQSIITS